MVAGCGGGGHPTGPTPAPGAQGRATPPPPADQPQIADGLRDRAAAPEAGNRRAYLATATRGMQRRDGVTIARAKRLQLRDVALDPGSITVHGQHATTTVEERFGMARVRGEFETRRRVRLVRRGRRWRV